jgi:hypothetical protein
MKLGCDCSNYNGIEVGPRSNEDGYESPVSRGQLPLPGSLDFLVYYCPVVASQVVPRKHLGLPRTGSRMHRFHTSLVNTDFLSSMRFQLRPFPELCTMRYETQLNNACAYRNHDQVKLDPLSSFGICTPDITLPSALIYIVSRPYTSRIVGVCVQPSLV